jgi:hypothetical protein
MVWLGQTAVWGGTPSKRLEPTIKASNMVRMGQAAGLGVPRPPAPQGPAGAAPSIGRTSASVRSVLRRGSGRS